MTATTDMRRVVQALYDYCGRGDWASAEALLTEDFFVIEAPHLPFAGVYHGRGGLREVFNRVFSMLDIAGVDIQDITVGENHAIAVLDMVLAGDPVTRVPLTEVFRFRDGKVCEIRPHYFDPAPVLAAASERSHTT